MTETRTPVEFTRLPITSPCPVPVEAETGRTFDDEGEPLPMEDRLELCAVDAAWMIGAQRICGHHLRDLFARGFFEGTYDQLVRDFYGAEYVDYVLEKDARPWSEWHRYSQEETRSWSDSAKEHGLA
jgi:hypothetical protein